MQLEEAKDILDTHFKHVPLDNPARDAWALAKAELNALRMRAELAEYKVHGMNHAKWSRGSRNRK